MVEKPALAFLVIEPFQVLPDYKPDLPEQDVDFLALRTPSDALVYNIVTVRGPTQATINLKGPIVLNRKGPRGEYIVRLDVEGTYWCQFAYQFAHEFCHVLTNYDRRKTDKNQWFEEAMGELASMYAVAAMGQTWQAAPPCPHWKSYAPNLTKYAEDLLRKEGSDLPAGQTLAAWYKANEPALRRDPYDRAKNRIVAKLLLPLMQESPQSWEAVGYLNNSAPDEEASFASYLSAWHKDAPAKHQPFVKRVAGMFGVAPGAPQSK